MKPAPRIPAYRRALRAESRCAAADLHRRLVWAGAARMRLRVAAVCDDDGARPERLADLAALRRHREASLAVALGVALVAFHQARPFCSGESKSARQLQSAAQGHLRTEILIGLAELRAAPAIFPASNA